MLVPLMMSTDDVRSDIFPRSRRASSQTLENTSLQGAQRTKILIRKEGSQNKLQVDVRHRAIFFEGWCNGVMDSERDFNLLGESVPQVRVSARTLALLGFFFNL